jgi:hypothetical protein
MQLQEIHSYMDRNYHIVSGEMWNTTWFLMVREIWPYEVGILEECSRIPSWLQFNE